MKPALLILCGLMLAHQAAQGVRAAEGVIPNTITIPAGRFIAGSDQAERDAAYDLDQAAYGHDRTRQWGWYDNERPRSDHHLPAFAISRTLITNRHYAPFIAATGHPAPDVDPNTWAGYGLIHPYARTRRHAWSKGRPPLDRDNHPVVMVSHHDAVAYAAWLSRQGVGHWRLPTELEWEKSARGADGKRFPWGDRYKSENLNSHDDGPFDTVAVGAYLQGTSPYGLVNPAGQVFEWTATATATAAGKPGRFLVKGGS